MVEVAGLVETQLLLVEMELQEEMVEFMVEVEVEAERLKAALLEQEEMEQQEY
jgi:hypothetical protein